MDPVTTPVRRPRHTRRWRVLAALLSVLALTLGAGGWVRHGSPEHAPASSSGPRGDIADEVGRPALAPATRPVHLEIPTIDVAARIRPLGLRPDQTVEVPRNPDDAGWYRFGSLPGQPGSAVILGHVDSIHGPAVFARLRSLEPGDRMSVVNADGSVARFEVRRVATYANADFPAQKVYRSQGRPGLALVTCGGRYDSAHGGYQANVVVFAVLADGTAS